MAEHREEHSRSGVSRVPEGVREDSSPQITQDDLEGLVHSGKWPEGGHRRWHCINQISCCYEESEGVLSKSESWKIPQTAGF